MLFLASRTKSGPNYLCRRDETRESAEHEKMRNLHLQLRSMITIIRLTSEARDRRKCCGGARRVLLSRSRQ